jgi:hypothetical protein
LRVVVGDVHPPLDDTGVRVEPDDAAAERVVRLRHRDLYGGDADDDRALDRDR